MARRVAAQASSPVDRVTSPRSATVELVAGRGHYQRVIAAVLAAETSVWIGTANVKELVIEDHRAAPGRRRSVGRTASRSILAALAELAGRGVELRLLHAERPSRPFVAAFAEHPALAAGLAMRLCPRVHWKIVVVDGALLYLGSANWTGAGLGARGSGRRNFELGVVTDDGPLLDEVQALYDRVWRGGECGGCKLRATCPRPLDQPVALAPAAVPAARRPRRPRSTARASPRRR